VLYSFFSFWAWSLGSDRIIDLHVCNVQDLQTKVCIMEFSGVIFTPFNQRTYQFRCHNTLFGGHHSRIGRLTYNLYLFSYLSLSLEDPVHVQVT
jgi:hypothetical protein